MNLPLQLDRAATEPLQDQLFEQLRQMILGGKLKPNSRVIATRFLAEQLGISRTTVLLAYERLIAEGYLETRPAIGTFVSATLPEEHKRDAVHTAVPDIPRQALLRPALMPHRREQQVPSPQEATDFDPARSDDSNLLPAKTWSKVVRRILEREPNGLAQPQPEGGLLALRRAIVDYLASTRGVMASVEQVIVVSGRRQVAGFVAHLFQRPGDRVLLEGPCDPQMLALFRARKAEIVQVPADEQGIRTDLLPDIPISLGYVTPARHNPLGGTLPQARRETLIAWARHAGAYLIEDDCDSELRYHGTMPLPLAALDPYGLVFHTGSFGKALGAGLGLGYVVVPPEFVDQILAIKQMAEAHNPWLEQMAVADLLATGELDHHLRRVRRIYLDRRDCLVEALRTHFGAVRLMGLETGTQLTWLLPDGYPPPESIAACAAGENIRLCVIPPDDEPLSPLTNGAIVFGFAALTEEALRDGIDRLAKALRQ